MGLVGLRARHRIPDGGQAVGGRAGLEWRSTSPPRLQGIGRIRDVRQGPDGFVYLAIDEEARDIDGPATGIGRLVPAGRR